MLYSVLNTSLCLFVVLHRSSTCCVTRYLSNERQVSVRVWGFLYTLHCKVFLIEEVMKLKNNVDPPCLCMISYFCLPSFFSLGVRWSFGSGAADSDASESCMVMFSISTSSCKNTTNINSLSQMVHWSQTHTGLTVTFVSSPVQFDSSAAGLSCSAALHLLPLQLQPAACCRSTTHTKTAKK